jgi:hypothetical protein
MVGETENGRGFCLLSCAEASRVFGRDAEPSKRARDRRIWQYQCRASCGQILARAIENRLTLEELHGCLVRLVESLERELSVKFLWSRLTSFGEESTELSRELASADGKAMLKDQYLQRMRTVAERHGCDVCGREFSMTYSCEEDGVVVRCVPETSEELVPDMSGLFGCQQLAWSCLMTMIGLSQAEAAHGLEGFGLFVGHILLAAGHRLLEMACTPCEGTMGHCQMGELMIRGLRKLDRMLEKACQRGKLYVDIPILGDSTFGTITMSLETHIG